MTLLVISPDYASHLMPLAAMAAAMRDPGEPVVVATGPATTGLVTERGFRPVPLRLGRGSNPGVIRVEEQPPGEDGALRGFFAATRRGMVETLAYQAAARRDDLLWEPVGTARAVLEVLDAVRPDRVLVDHLAFSATLALRAAGVPYLDGVLGHPTALPVGDEVYGFPAAWPRCFRPAPGDLDELLALCRSVRDSFTQDWNDALTRLAPGATPVADAFAAHGPQVLFNYPERLHDPARTALLPPHTFLGGSLRPEVVPDDVARWLEAPDERPVVYVSLGSFLSARADVLARIADALAGLPVRVALATGSAPAAAIGPLPGHWLVRGFLPQISVLRHARLAISHGGNNSVTEALALGVGLVLLPFSTDQFAGAAAVERAGVGQALDPNAASPAEIRAAVTRVLGPVLA